jgi:hypothetical protein
MLEFDSLLIQAKVLNATVTPISLVTGTIKIFPIGTKDQTTDTLTKALPQNTFF